MLNKHHLLRFFPFLGWPRPTLQSMRKDAWAGTSVGLVLIPQAIAYATLAGMPPETGLYAALVPCVIGVLFGSSPLLSVGPVAMTSMLVFGSLSALSEPGSPLWIAMAVWLAVYSGLIQLAIGAFSLGRIANLVSQPVVTGFINAAAVLIIASQLPALFGAELSGGWLASAQRAIHAPGTFLSLLIGVSAILLLLVFKRKRPTWPGILIVTIIGVLLGWAVDLGSAGVRVVGPIPAGLPAPAWPAAISFEHHQELWPAALVLALISFTEAMSSCRVLARRRREQWDENQELIGQGLAKVASAAFGSFPVSGSLSRSALNAYAGAVSAWSSLFTALCVMAGLLFLTDWVAYLPRPVLAAMIIVPVAGLIDIGAMWRLFGVSRSDALIAVATFGITLFSMPRLHWGVFAGIGLTMASFLFRYTRPRIVTVSLHADGSLRDSARFNLPPLAQDVLAVRMDSELNFLSSPALERFVANQLRRNPQVRRLLLCAGSINSVDATGVDTFQSLQTVVINSGVKLYVSNIKQQVWQVLDAAGVISSLPEGHIFQTDVEAVNALKDDDAQPF